MTTENVLERSGSIIASARFSGGAATQEDGIYYFYHYDVRGSTTAVIGPEGSLQAGYKYDEFGNLEKTGTFLNDVTFTGSVTDTSTGLQYMNARFYEPATGRFITQDSYTGSATEPWTQHLYAYCGNNPTNMIDPTGHNPNQIQEELSALRNQQATSQKMVNGYQRIMDSAFAAGVGELYNYAKRYYDQHTARISNLEKKIQAKTYAEFKQL